MPTKLFHQKLLQTMDNSHYQSQSIPSLSSSSDHDSFTSADHLLEKHESQPDSQVSFWKRHGGICTHIIIFLFYFATITMLAAENSKLRKPTVIYTPANEAVTWKVTKWNNGDSLGTDFTGEPRPELEKAWEGLLGNMNIRLSSSDIKHFGREDTAVALPDGSGYLGTLNVYHEIHCVRWLQKYIHQDHYFPNLSEMGKKMNLRHSEHCINTLRNFAQCHGDVGLITYSWSPLNRKPSANGTVHQCVDWEKLARWTKERSVDMFEPGLLVHPSLGVAYPDGEGDGHLGAE